MPAPIPGSTFVKSRRQQDVFNGGQPRAGYQPSGAAYPQADPRTGIMTPAQSATARNMDMQQGTQRWRNTVANDPAVMDILARRKDMSYGLNAEEMQAARDQMALGLQGKSQDAVRQLYSQQARSGIRGGMAGAQQARLQRQLGQDRAAAEQKLLLDNYALKRQGLDDYSKSAMGLKIGELGQGVTEAQLGVGDRTGYANMILANRLAAQAGDQGGGLFKWLGELFI